MTNRQTVVQAQGSTTVMLRLALLGGLVLLSGATPAYSDTCLSGISVWPPQDVRLPRNPRIVIEGNGYYAAILSNISSRHPYLWGPRGKVYLNVEAIYHTTYPGPVRTQAVLTPARRLMQNARYDLRFFEGYKPRVAPSWAGWRTGHKEDRRPPAWDYSRQPTTYFRGIVQLEAKQAEDRSPYADVALSAPVTDDSSNVQVLVQLWDAEVGRNLSHTSSWLFPVSDGQLRLSSGQCGGIFEPAINRFLAGTATAIDPAGNRAVYSAAGISTEAFFTIAIPPPPPTITIDLVDPHPVVIRRVEPSYPRLARMAGHKGVVELELVLDADGRVTATRIVRSIPLLDTAATDALSQWLFEKGEPARRVRVSLDFEAIEHIVR